MLIAAINMRSDQCLTLSSKLNPTGNEQVCLSMTLLHILTCSLVHDLELYHVTIENYLTNLVTEDRWGALQLLYAFWGAATAEIIQFLVDSYQSLYSDHVFNWTMMVKTMGRCDTPKESIDNLLCVKQMHFPDQPIDWDYLLDQFALPLRVSFSTPFKESMQYLVNCGVSDRVESLAFKVWCDNIIALIHSVITFYIDNQYIDNEYIVNDNLHIIRRFRVKITHFEDEYLKLKAVTTLTLWK